MTPAQIDRVRESFRKVVPIAATAAEMFYAHLFKIAPETRKLFKPNLASQYDKLMQMLLWVVANLHQIETVLPAVQDLGRRHLRYEVEPEYYDRVGEALIWTLGKGLGDDFTPEVRDAWIAAYSLLSGAMLDAANAEPERTILSKPMLDGACTTVYGAIGWQTACTQAREEQKLQLAGDRGGDSSNFWQRGTAPDG